MLAPHEAFKVGFLARCVHDGLTPDQMLDRVKFASDLLEKRAFLGTLLGKGIDLAKGVGGAAMSYGLPLALAAPPILGGAAGYGLAKATDIDDTDVEEIKNRELVEELKRQTGNLKQQKLSRQHRQTARPTGRMFM